MKTISSSGLPEMPRGIEVGLIKEFVEIFSPTTECPHEYLFAGFITCLGLAASPFVARKNALQTQPRLYACNVGTSGITRRSTGTRAAADVIEKAWGCDSIKLVRGFGSSEGLLRSLESARKVPVLLYLDELELLTRKANIAGSAGIVPLHSLFEENRYHHTLRDGGLVIEDAYLGIIANATFDRFSSIWQADDLDSGFFYRWMIVSGEPKVRIPDPPPPDQGRLDIFSENLRGLRDRLSSQARTGKIPIGFDDDQARTLWEKYYKDEIDPSDPICNRIDTIGDRLMLIVALAKSEFSITAATVVTVLEFLRYEVGIRRILRPIVADNPIAAMEQKILARLPNAGNQVVRRSLYRAVHADRAGTEIFDRALKGLVAADMLAANGNEYVRLS